MYTYRMRSHALSVSDAIEFGWQKTRQHSGLMFKIMLTFFALQVVSAIVDAVLGDTFLGFLAMVALTITGIMIGAGFTKISLHIAKEHAAHYLDLMPPAHTVWYYFCATAVAGVAIVMGFILLIIPGIYLLVRLSMVRFAILDMHSGARGESIMQSLYHSGQITRGHFWKLLLLFLVLVGINILGFAFLYVGLLVSVPVSALAYAHAYTQLKKAH